MAFMLGLRIVSYGVVGAAAILTHETAKAYKERLYDWAREKFTSHGSPPQAQGPPTSAPTPTPTPTTTHNECDAATYQHSLDGDADLPLPQMQQQLTTTCKDNDALLSLPQLQQDQRPTHPSVLLQPQQFTATEKDDDAHLSVLLLHQQQLTTADKEDHASFLVLQQQQQLLTAAAGRNHDAAYLPVQQQQQQLTAIDQDNDVNDLNHDQAVKTRHLIDIEFKLKASSVTSKDHDAVKIEGGGKHEQQAPRLHGRGAAFFFAKAFNGTAKSQLHGFFCWARGLFEDKRWPTVRRVIEQIVRKILFLLVDNLFHYTFKSTNPVRRQFWTVIFNEVKRAFL